MKNKKGFTLVELLCVIVIIAVVAVIGTVSMITIKEKMKKKTFAESLKTIINSAETYGSDNKEIIDETDKTLVLDGSSKKYYITTVGELLKTKYYTTEDTNKDDKGNTITSVNYYTDDNHSINDLQILVYESNASGRVNACIPDETLNEQFTGNLLLINDTTKEEFGDLGLYCTDKAIASSETIISLKVSDENVWKPSKILTIKAVNNEYKITNYKIVKSKEECKLDSGWTNISSTNEFNQTKAYNEYDDFGRRLDAIGQTIWVCIKTNNNTIKTRSINISKIDSTAPTCGTITGAKTNWTSINFDISVECNDTGDSACVESIYTKTYNNSITTDHIVISDNAGNTTSCPVDVYLDKTIPLTTLSTENTESNKVKVTANVTNYVLSGIKEYTFKSDSIEVTQASNIYTFDFGDCNNHTIYVKATSNAGLSSEWVSKSVKPACAPPSITPTINGHLNGTVASDFIKTNETATIEITTPSDGAITASIAEFRRDSNGATSGTSNQTITNLNVNGRKITIKGKYEGWVKIKVDVAATTTYTSATTYVEVYIYKAASITSDHTSGTGWFSDSTGWWWQPSTRKYYYSGWEILPETQYRNGMNYGTKTSMSDCNVGSSYLNSGYRCKWFKFDSGGYMMESTCGCYGLSIENLKNKLKTGSYIANPKTCSVCIGNNATVNNRHCYD